LHDPDSGEIKSLLRLSLVNSPNLYDTEICSRRKPALTTPEKIAVLSAKQAVHMTRDEPVMTEAEHSVAGHFAGVTDQQFAAASTKRGAREADGGATFDIRPFVMKKVGVRFAPVGKALKPRAGARFVANASRQSFWCEGDL
jgi:hypothetical protein